MSIRPNTKDLPWWLFAYKENDYSTTFCFVAFQSDNIQLATERFKQYMFESGEVDCFTVPHTDYFMFVVGPLSSKPSIQGFSVEYIHDDYYRDDGYNHDTLGTLKIVECDTHNEFVKFAE